MGRKIFASYKYFDNNVESLPSKSWFENTTVRDYVDKFESLLENEDDIYKGESDGEDLSSKPEEEIEELLKQRIYDSSVTIIFISKGMKENRPEKDQWIPWEVCYSIKKITRAGRTSQSNAVLCVVIPDSGGSYDYLITQDTDCNCTNYNTLFLFPILRKNMFNIKQPKISICNNQTLYHGYSSYLHIVKWEDFEKDYKSQIDISVYLKDIIDDYTLCKKLES